MLQPPVVCGHSRCVGELYTQLLNDMLGTKLVAIRGYRGSNEITLAIERGELDGVVGAALLVTLTRRTIVIAGKLTMPTACELTSRLVAQSPTFPT